MYRRIYHSYRASFSGLGRETWLFSGVMMVNRASTMVVPFMSMYITQSLHRSIGDAGLIITLFGLGSVAGSAAGGFFIDRVGFRAVQVFTSLIGGILFILFGLVTHFALLCLLTVLMSFVSEAFRPANLTAVVTYSRPENLTRSYSLNRLAVNLGWGFGASLGGLLAAINYHLLFWVEGLAYITVCILLLLLLPPQKQPAAGPHKAAAGEAALSPWKDGFLLRFLLIATLYNSCFLLMFRLAPVYWKEQFRLNESVIGIILGLNGLIIALFEMVLIRQWERRNRPMNYILSGTLLVALSYVFLLLPGPMPTLSVLTAMVVLTMGEMMALPFINTTVMKRSSEQNRGSYASAYALSWSVSLVAGPGGASLIIEHLGYRPLWVVLIFVCILCAMGFYFLAGRKSRG